MIGPTTSRPAGSAPAAAAAAGQHPQWAPAKSATTSITEQLSDFGMIRGRLDGGLAGIDDERQGRTAGGQPQAGRDDLGQFVLIVDFAPPRQQQQTTQTFTSTTAPSGSLGDNSKPAAAGQVITPTITNRPICLMGARRLPDDSCHLIEMSVCVKSKSITSATGGGGPDDRGERPPTRGAHEVGNKSEPGMDERAQDGGLGSEEGAAAATTSYDCDLGDGRAGRAPAIKSDGGGGGIAQLGGAARTATAKRRLVYERIDRLVMEINGLGRVLDLEALARSSTGARGPSAATNDCFSNVKLPFKEGLFDGCLCINLLNIRVASARLLMLEQLIELENQCCQPAAAAATTTDAGPECSRRRTPPTEADQMAAGCCQGGADGRTSKQEADRKQPLPDETRQELEKSWLSMERLTTELRLALLSELMRVAGRNGK
jgi:hypothetical protein